MKSKKIILLAFILLNFCGISLYAQSPIDKNNYMILTFRLLKNRIHSEKNYYWIVPLYSTKDVGSAFHTLYLEPYFDKSELDICCNNGKISVLESEIGDTVKLSIDYLKKLESLCGIVAKNRKKIHTLSNKRPNSNISEKVKVYMTPINGEFCRCQQVLSENLTKYFDEGTLYLPIGEFSFDKNVYKTKLIEQFRSFDFSDFNYENTH
jgi:hypothetical protein